MDSGLTLSPVINLFFALTPADKPGSPPHVLERVPFQKERPSLGDFTRLWNFLGHEPPTRTVTPASPRGLPPPVAFSAKFPPPKSETPDSIPDTSGTTSCTPLSAPSPPILLPVEALKPPRKEKKKAKFSGVQPTVSALPQSSFAKQQKQPSKIKVMIDGQEVVWEQRPVIEASLPIMSRRAALLSKLRKEFPHDFDPLRRCQKPVHVFIDNSNILIGFIDCIKAQRGYKKPERVQRPSFSFFHFTIILERFRPVARKVLVGSLPHTPVIDEAKKLQYKCDLLQKIETEAPVEPPKRKRAGSPSSGSDSPTTKYKKRMAKKEQGVDEVLNLKMCESIIDTDVPGTLVLASGDGAIGEFSEGFLRTVERALKKGWKVELVTFSANISRSYTDKTFRRLWNRQFTIIHLDQYAEELLGTGSADPQGV